MRLVQLDTFKEFYDYEGIGELTCPVLWTPQWIEGEKAHEGELVRPEYDKKDRTIGQPEIWHGDYAASISTTSATHTATLTRQFAVNPGPVRATVMAMLKSSDDAGHGVRIGIDPYGGEDFQSEQVVWSAWYSTHPDDPGYGGYQYGRWVELPVDALAISGTITVHLLTHNDYRENAAAHFDYVQLFETDPGGSEVKDELIAIRDDLNAVIASL
jgi:hypothetical protein